MGKKDKGFCEVRDQRSADYPSTILQGRMNLPELRGRRRLHGLREKDRERRSVSKGIIDALHPQTANYQPVAVGMDRYWIFSLVDYPGKQAVQTVWLLFPRSFLGYEYQAGN